MDAGEAAVLRFAANVFLHPQSVRALVEYWLRHYVPLVRVVGRLQPPAATGSDMSSGAAWVGALVTRLLRGPTGFALAGQGSMTIGARTHTTQWRHWLNFFTDGQDLSLQVPVAYLVTAQLPHALAALANVYAHARAVWQLASRTSPLGEHAFDMCRYTNTIAACYPTALVVTETYRSFVHALRSELAPDVLRAHAPEIMDTATRPLRGPHVAALSVFERGMVAVLYDKLTSPGALHDVAHLAHELDIMCNNLARDAAACYARLRESPGLDAVFGADNALAQWTLEDDGAVPRSVPTWQAHLDAHLLLT